MQNIFKILLGLSLFFSPLVYSAQKCFIVSSNNQFLIFAGSSDPVKAVVVSEGFKSLNSAIERLSAFQRAEMCESRDKKNTENCYAFIPTEGNPFADIAYIQIGPNQDQSRRLVQVRPSRAVDLMFSLKSLGQCDDIKDWR